MRYSDKLSRHTNEGTVFGKESTILAKVNASSHSVPTLETCQTTSAKWNSVT